MATDTDFSTYFYPSWLMQTVHFKLCISNCGPRSTNLTCPVITLSPNTMPARARVPTSRPSATPALALVPFPSSTLLALRAPPFPPLLSYSCPSRLLARPVPLPLRPLERRLSECCCVPRLLRL